MRFMLTEKKNGDEVEESNFTHTTIPECLWTAVCGGDLDYVKKFPRETLKKARYERFGSEHSLIMGAIRNKEVQSQYPKIDEQTFMKLIKLDPTYKPNVDSVGTYGKWILNLFNKGNLKNLGHVTDVLNRFEDSKK